MALRNRIALEIFLANVAAPLIAPIILERAFEGGIAGVPEKPPAAAVAQKFFVRPS
jgi:hypothetical protein